MRLDEKHCACHAHRLLSTHTHGLWRGSCSGAGRVLDPGGGRAALTLNLWWFMLGLGLTTYFATMAALALALWSRRVSEQRRKLLFVIGGIAIPGLILVVLIGADLATLVPVS